MMLFGSFFSLSLSLIVLHSCRLTDAETLAISAVKRGRIYDPIECPGHLPFIPSEFPQDFQDLLHLCASRAGHPHNLGCVCLGEYLVCGLSHWTRVRDLLYWCHISCGCPDRSHVKAYNPPEYTDPLNYWDSIAAVQQIGGTEWSGSESGSGTGSPGGLGSESGAGSNSGNPLAHQLNPSTGGTVAHTCSKKCTSVNRDCDWFFTGDCKCYAPPVSLFFWFSGDCGAVPHLPKRDLAQQRHSFYLNATAHLAPPNTTTALPPPPAGLAIQLASGLLPSPCNSNYVSFACVDSPNGIVHEAPEKWLGALVPANTKTLPPVPDRFLRIHSGGEGSLVDLVGKVTAE